MLQDAQELFRKCKVAFTTIYSELMDIRARLKGDSDLETHADIAMAMKSCYKYVDDLRKELKRTQEQSERIACILWLKDSDGDPIRTDYVTAIPRIKQMAAIPKRSSSPLEYSRLMTFLGVPEELWGDDAVEEVVRVHWPGFVEYLTKLAEDGLPMPDGIDPDKTYPVYSLTLRQKKEVDE